MEAYRRARVAHHGARNVSDAVFARSGCGVSKLLCPPGAIPEIQAQECRREPAVSGRGNGLDARGGESAEVGIAQAGRIASPGRAAGPGDPLARCRGALPRQFLRRGGDVLDANHASRGGRGCGPDAFGDSLDRRENPQSETLSRTPEVPASAATVSCTAAEG